MQEKISVIVKTLLFVAGYSFWLWGIQTALRMGVFKGKLARGQQTRLILFEMLIGIGLVVSVIFIMLTAK